MTDNDRIARQFERLYVGNMWLKGTLGGMDAAAAAWKPGATLHSCYELVFHVDAWRRLTLARLNGDAADDPDDNYFPPHADVDERGWSEARVRFFESAALVTARAANVRLDDLDVPVAPTQMTVCDVLFEVLEHDSYHFGQLRMVSKLVAAR